MIEGIGDDELDDDWRRDTPWGEDGLGNSLLGPTGLGCGIDTGVYSLLITVIAIIVGVNLRRTKQVQ